MYSASYSSPFFPPNNRNYIILYQPVQCALSRRFKGLKPIKPPTDETLSFGKNLFYEYPYPQKYKPFPESLSINIFNFHSSLKFLGFALQKISAVVPDAKLCIENTATRSRSYSFLIILLFYASTYLLDLISSPRPPQLPVARSFRGRSRIVIFYSCYIFKKKLRSFFASARDCCLQSGLSPTADFAHQTPPPSNKSLSLGKTCNDYL